jgi:hypothetical protein
MIRRFSFEINEVETRSRLQVLKHIQINKKLKELNQQSTENLIKHRHRQHWKRCKTDVVERYKSLIVDRLRTINNKRAAKL